MKKLAEKILATMMAGAVLFSNGAVDASAKTVTTVNFVNPTAGDETGYYILAKGAKEPTYVHKYLATRQSIFVGGTDEQVTIEISTPAITKGTIIKLSGVTIQNDALLGTNVGISQVKLTTVVEEGYTYEAIEDYSNDASYGDYYYDQISGGIVNGVVYYECTSSDAVSIWFDSYDTGMEGGDGTQITIYPDCRVKAFVWNTTYDEDGYFESGSTDYIYLPDLLATGTTTQQSVVPSVDVSAVFDATYYATHNTDLVSTGITTEAQLKAHFVSSGMAEGRAASADFDLAVYKAKNPDLVSAFGDDNRAYYMHYINGGKAEGRVAK